MATNIGRRQFIGALGGATIAWSLTARAQQPSMPVIGFLGSRGPNDDPQLLDAFRRGLKETGFIEGQSVAIEYRFADNQYQRLPALATDLIQRHVALIAANGPPALAAKAASTTIPIVFVAGYNPVEMGLVASLNRPGGNVTGVTILDVELGPKRLDLLRQFVPAATVVAALINPTNADAEIEAKDFRTAARTLGLQLHVLRASSDRDFDSIFADIVQLRVGGLVIGGDPFFNSRSERLGALALQHMVPAIYQFHAFAASGGLVGYGASLIDAYRLVGVYAGRILKGEKPADLPVQQAAKIELIINLKTAKALGLTVPLTLQTSADEVIE